MSEQPVHIDKQDLSTLLGIPPRAIVRWTRASNPIPFTGKGYDIMFPKDAALAWVRDNHAGLYGRRFGGGV